MAEFICTHCGWEGERKRRLRGSKALEIAIWSVLLLPGPFYSLWRRTGTQTECPNCNLPMLVKRGSTEGQIAQRKFDLELGLAMPASKQKDTPSVFGNDKPAGKPAKKKPVDPEQW